VPLIRFVLGDLGHAPGLMREMALRGKSVGIYRPFPAESAISMRRC
jgi:hypothetical protein